MVRLLLVLSIIGTLIFSLSSCALYSKQRDYLYHPQPYTQNVYPSMTIKSNDADINVITLIANHSTDTVQAEGNNKAIIYFGGNAEPVMSSVNMFKPLHQGGYDVYLVNYRGYGTSTGTITEQNNYHDALAVYAKIADRYDSISVMGRSMGSGVATYLAEAKPVDKLVLIVPYDSLLTLVQKKLPFLPIRLMLKDTYPSITRAKNINSQVLILSAEKDTLIPVAHARNLAKAFADKSQYHEVANANHNDLMSKKEALTVLYQFFDT